MKEIIRRQNYRKFLAKLPPASLLGVSAGICQRALVRLEFRWGRTIDQKIPQLLGSFVRYHTVSVTSNQ
jgi:hypothetical protein